MLKQIFAELINYIENQIILFKFFYHLMDKTCFVFVGSRLKAFLPILLRAETRNDQIFLIIQLSHPGSESCKISGDHMLRQLSNFIKKFSLEDN